MLYRIKVISFLYMYVSFVWFAYSYTYFSENKIYIIAPTEIHLRKCTYMIHDICPYIHKCMYMCTYIEKVVVFHLIPVSYFRDMNSWVTLLIVLFELLR